MSISSTLYTLLIGPLKLLFEVVYTFAYFLTDNAGLSIVALSLVMNILLMPLYKRADDVQAKENDIQKKLKPGVDHIKKVFKGDEQYMVLNTYYRQNGYKPIYALRSSISLLLQIPFFIAAYDYLSNEYTVLSSSFGPIGSLGSPDGLLGGVNLLPILMTVINIISSIIYTKGQPLKNNIQLYVMALAFLVFLYDRPSGLVFYWTLNNLFSLIKNIFMKLKNSQKILEWALSVFGLFLLVLILFVYHTNSVLIRIAVISLSLLLQSPLILSLSRKGKAIFPIGERLIENKLFYIETFLLCIYFGLFVPCHVIQTSPDEFINKIAVTGPVIYILNTFFLSFGVFFIWFTIYYLLMNDTVKSLFQYVLALACIIFPVNYLFFGRDLGTMSNMLIYDRPIMFSGREILMNLAAVVLIFIAITLIYHFRKKAIASILAVVIITISIISFTNLIRIQKDVSSSIAEIRKAKEERATIELSRNGNNVVVIILDRAFGYYVPYIMNEKPELKQIYDGFVFYPNTMSYSMSTNVAIPSVYGGYEYTPERMDERDNEYLMDKHNESLRVMPVLFNENGFDVTVFDPAYANYQSPGELSVYDEYPYIRRYNTQAGMFDYDTSMVRDNLDLLNRNLFCFGVMKSFPLILQPTLYNGGAYYSISRFNSLFSKDTLLDVSSKAYMKQSFVESFAVLQNMINITNIKNDDSDNLLLMYNMATHEPTLLQTPDYTMQINVDNYDFDQKTEYSRVDAEGRKLTLDSYEKMSHYHINMGSMLQIGEWLDYLKEEKIYDNTRIIIVADHGVNIDLRQDQDMILDDYDLLMFNPMLMVKDFNAKGFVTDKSFMTNADTIILATEDLIEDPINPFTGNRIDDSDKDGYQHILISNFQVKENNGKRFLPGENLYVKDDIFDLNNWIIE